MHKLISRSIQSRLLSGSTLAGALMLSSLVGCGNEFVDARPTVSQVGRALTLFADSDVVALKGTYHGCNTYADTDAWTMAAGSGSADSDQVKVVKGDTNCRLKLAGMDINLGTSPVVKTSFTTTAFDLVAAYQSQAVLFSDGTNKFFANAKLSDLLYMGAFDVTMLYAKDPTSINDGQTAGYAMVTSNSVSSSGVPTPDYSSYDENIVLSVRQDYTLDVDATGGLLLTHHSVDGDKYILSQTDPGTTIASMDSFWTTNASSAVAIMPGSDPSFDAATDFHLTAGADLSSPIVWYVLVANWDVSSTGTRSYEKFTLTYTHP